MVKDRLIACMDYYKNHFPDYVGIDKQYENVILEIVNKDSIIADIGCGRTSRFAKHKGSYGKLIGIDVSEEEIQHNQEIDEKIVCNAGEKISLPNESIDLVVSFFVLEHVANPDQFFSEIRRILKPAGKFVLLAPNFLYPVFFLNKIISNQKFKKIILAKIAKRDPGTVFPVYYKANSLFALNRLRRKGIFKSIEVTYLNGPFDLHFSFFLFRLAVYFEKFLYFIKADYLLPHMIIVGEK
jgi:SAM-dependent methyltransferase